MAATFQRYSAGRLLLNMVTGGESAEQRAYGDFLGKADRYARCAEFLDMVTQLWRGETVTYNGKYLRAEGAWLARQPDPVPPLYFGGSSAEAGPVAARYSDVYLTWGEPPAAVEAKLRWMDSVARASLELFQSDIAPVLRREIPDPPWGWGGGPLGDDAVPARAVAATG
jgi:alkanesulfonate monooxygenase